jgi:hypothetical protein
MGSVPSERRAKAGEGFRVFGRIDRNDAAASESSDPKGDAVFREPATHDPNPTDVGPREPPRADPGNRIDSLRADLEPEVLDQCPRDENQVDNREDQVQADEE